MKEGAAFEDQVSKFYTSLSAADRNVKITKNERIVGPDGVREFDILIEHKLIDYEIRTFVECKDHKRPIDIQVIDSFASKLLDVRANKGIIIARNGFSKNAIQKAKRLSIDLCTFDRAENIIFDSSANLPIIVKDVEFLDFGFELRHIDRDKGTTISFFHERIINDLNLQAIFDLADINDIVKGGSIEIDLIEKLAPSPVWVRGENGSHVYLELAKAKFSINQSIFFGFLFNDFDFFAKLDHSTQKIIAHGEVSMSQLTKRLKRFDSFSKIPEYAAKTAITIAMIPKTIKIENVKCSLHP